jgi:hypothetical protein
MGGEPEEPRQQSKIGELLVEMQQLNKDESSDERRQS